MGDMRTVAPRGRVRAAVTLWTLAGVALLVSHDAVFAIQAGPGQGLTDALRSAGHGYWGAASALIAATGLIVGLLAAARVLRLRRRAQRLGVAPPPSRRANRILRAWGWLFLIVSTGFFVQENLEHLATHGHLVGAGALAGPEYPLALPVIAAVTFGAGIVGGLIGGAESGLLAAIASALAGLRPRRAPAAGRIADATVARPSVLARRGASRAPPEMVVLL